MYCFLPFVALCCLYFPLLNVIWSSYLKRRGCDVTGRIFFPIKDCLIGFPDDAQKSGTSALLHPISFPRKDLLHLTSSTFCPSKMQCSNCQIFIQPLRYLRHKVSKAFVLRNKPLWLKSSCLKTASVRLCTPTGQATGMITNSRSTGKMAQAQRCISPNLQGTHLCTLPDTEESRVSARHKLLGPILVFVRYTPHFHNSDFGWVG